MPGSLRTFQWYLLSPFSFIRYVPVGSKLCEERDAVWSTLPSWLLTHKRSINKLCKANPSLGILQQPRDPALNMKALWKTNDLSPADLPSGGPHGAWLAKAFFILYMPLALPLLPHLHGLPVRLLCVPCSVSHCLGPPPCCADALCMMSLVER